jgi:hypothetical protein
MIRTRLDDIFGKSSARSALSQLFKFSQITGTDSAVVVNHLVELLRWVMTIGPHACDETNS